MGSYVFYQLILLWSKNCDGVIFEILRASLVFCVNFLCKDLCGIDLVPGM